MKISEVSKQTGLSIPTIRYYTDQNMIPSVTRDLDNQRVFDDEAVVWLEGIKVLRELGVPLSEIKEYITLSQKSGPIALRTLLIKQQALAKVNFAQSAKILTKLNKKIKLEEDIMNGKKRDSLSAARRFSL
ncbi:MerR family transcriptional regulator [Companilactobacillus crustorum]|uniref:MerR family transcriptional regulator n=1 Tax=Companilactobacillus crustorum TaxID=392416 RepID=UPI00237DDB24|nr:MerR family transcriptional regulator [Companilactobacillus crustorum]WDT65552.1 MerR family transcriptional regulator [Companilactobacillus crustorum]